MRSAGNIRVNSPTRPCRPIVCEYLSVGVYVLIPGRRFGDIYNVGDSQRNDRVRCEDVNPAKLTRQQLVFFYDIINIPVDFLRLRAAPCRFSCFRWAAGAGRLVRLDNRINSPWRATQEKMCVAFSPVFAKKPAWGSRRRASRGKYRSPFRKMRPLFRISYIAGLFFWRKRKHGNQINRAAKLNRRRCVDVWPTPPKT